MPRFDGGVSRIGIGGTRGILGRAVVVASILVVLSGCADGKDRTPSGPRSVADALDWIGFSGKLPDDQIAAFDDDVITYEEYRQAVAQTRECVRGSSPYIVVGEIKADGKGALSFSFEVTAPAGADPEEYDIGDQVYKPCESKYAEPLSTVYLITSAPSVEELESVRPKVIECLKAGGLQLADDASREAIFEELSSHYSEKTGEPDAIDPLEVCFETYPQYFAALPERKS